MRDRLQPLATQHTVTSEAGYAGLRGYSAVVPAELPQLGRLRVSYSGLRAK
jgi:hypothetical protein